MRSGLCRFVVWVLALLCGGVTVAANEPVLSVLAPAANQSGPTTLRGEATVPLRAPAGGVLYFTVDTRFIGGQAGKGGVVHRRLHFVVGGFGPDGSAGKVRVNGPGVEPLNGRTPLIDVTDGWVWVSDQAPAGWSGHTSAGHEPPVTAGVFSEAGPASHTIGADTAVGWSIITLLRGEWSWAGAVGTEFIYRVAPNAGGGQRLEAVYGLDSASQSMLTLTSDSRAITVDGGAFTGVKGRAAAPGRLSGRWMDGGPHKSFVKAVRDAVAKVGRD